jgi:hypothetical protein
VKKTVVCKSGSAMKGLDMFMVCFDNSPGVLMFILSRLLTLLDILNAKMWKKSERSH